MKKLILLSMILPIFHGANIDANDATSLLARGGGHGGGVGAGRGGRGMNGPYHPEHPDQFRGNVPYRRGEFGEDPAFRREVRPEERAYQRGYEQGGSVNGGNGDVIIEPEYQNQQQYYDYPY